jgi:hypothetical protein
MIAGVTLLTGKRNPVMLVRAVVTRKSKVTTGRRLPPIIPRTTTNPDAIPIKLMTTCKVVNASKLMPRIMMVSFHKCGVASSRVNAGTQ